MDELCTELDDLDELCAELDGLDELCVELDDLDELCVGADGSCALLEDTKELCAGFADDSVFCGALNGLDVSSLFCSSPLSSVFSLSGCVYSLSLCEYLTAGAEESSLGAIANAIKPTNAAAATDPAGISIRFKGDMGFLVSAVLRIELFSSIKSAGGASVF